MNNINFPKFRQSKTTVSCLQWTPKGTLPSQTLQPGHIAGFEDFFRDSPDVLSSLLIGVTGNHSTETTAWLGTQADKAGMDQHVTIVEIGLFSTYTERINGVCADGLPSYEYDTTKATVVLKNKIQEAWVHVVLRCNGFSRQEKVDLLSAAASGIINKCLPLSSYLFSKTVEAMHHEFQNARAIIFPAIPIAYSDWKGNPARLIAFRKEAII